MRTLRIVASRMSSSSRRLRALVASSLILTGLIGVGVPSAAVAGTENLTINAAAASTIVASLNKGTNVIIETTATGASGPGTKSAGPGDIIIDASLTWTGDATLSLSAFRNVTFDAGKTFTSSGKGSLLVRADNTGDGKGTVGFSGSSKINFAAGTGTVAILYNPSKYTAPTDYAAHVVTNGAVTGQFTAFMLVNSATQLQAVETNLAGDYALGRNIDAGSIANFAPIGNESTPFTGKFDGRGHAIANLTIDNAADTDVGLFGDVGSGATISDLTLTDVKVTGDAAASLEYANIGSLAGENYGTVSSVSVDGAVRAGGEYDNVAGLVGSNGRTIENSASAATVTGGGLNNDVGGLVGVSYDGGSIYRCSASGHVGTGGYIGGLVGSNNGATIQESFATGAVTSGDITGGLVGANFTASKILNSYATGAVTTGVTSAYVGGLAGYNHDEIDATFATGVVTATGSGSKVGGLVGSIGSGGTAAASYWDTQTTHQSTSAEGTGRTTAQLQSGTLPAGFSSAVWGAKAGHFPYLLWHGGP